MNQWIDVNARLPELNPRSIEETVLVFVTGNVSDSWVNPYTGAKLVKGKWCGPDNYPVLKMEVTLWYPMPDACRLVWDEGKVIAIPDLATV